MLSNCLRKQSHSIPLQQIYAPYRVRYQRHWQLSRAVDPTVEVWAGGRRGQRTQRDGENRTGTILYIVSMARIAWENSTWYSTLDATILRYPIPTCELRGR